ncbi:MAG: DUF1778 domain-containing protein [Pseudomonadota bacterium]
MSTPHEEQNSNKARKNFAGKTATIKMRVDPYCKALIDKAAQIQHTDMSNFILHYAFEAAKQVVSNETQIGLSAEEYDDFCQKLDNPPKENIQKMNDLLNSKTILDQH